MEEFAIRHCKDRPDPPLVCTQVKERALEIRRMLSKVDSSRVGRGSRVGGPGC